VGVAWGTRARNPSPGESWELPKYEEKKLEVGWGYRIILAKQTTLKYVFLLQNTFRTE